MHSVSKAPDYAETIIADGTDQPGVFGTTFSVTVEAPNSWKVVRKTDGKILLTANWKLSEDGNTLDDDFTAIQSDRSKFNVYYVYRRTAGQDSTAHGKAQARR